MTTAKSRAELWRRLSSDLFLIVGFTELTGLSVARLFEAQGVRYAISDLRPRAELEPLLAQLRHGPERVHTGPQTVEQLDGITQVLLSPGVPRSIPLIRAARQRGLPVWADIDFLYPFVSDRTIVAITGTDGKTTTATLMAAILAGHGRTVLAGNVGVPVCACYDELLESEFLVLEVSSFMLEELRCLRPNVSTILNLAEDHVDRYASHTDYVRAKQRLVRHCTADDVFVRNVDDPELARFAPPGRMQVVDISRAGPSFNEARRCFRVGGLTLPIAACRLQGDHFVSNILACIAMAEALEVPADRILEAVRDFEGLPHRYEPAGEHGGVRIIDDSKATTVHAVEHAVLSSGDPVVLIMGGREKDLDVTPLQAHAHRIAYLQAYGESGERIRRVLGWAASGYVYDFDEAVRQAIARCRPGDTLLLSPGCTSWDQFPSYEVRGARFKALARELLGAGSVDP
jgi:UDP-N-acetylmuramoylalanine--D-glutamate ligase